MTDKQDSTTSLTYKDAGVDIEAGNALVDRIKSHARRTMRPEVIGGLGGFGASFALPAGYKEPILISGTDGVGTKLKLAMDTGQHDTIGIDLVAMCVNDLIVGGAEPLFFLDYYATGELDVDMASQVVKGIADGCELAGCALVGGETAEMPGMYQGNDYDLAGFCVGIVEKDEVITGNNCASGDALIALSSSGPHSNGYSLIRKILERDNTDLSQSIDSRTLLEALMEPTRIYVRSILSLKGQVNIKSMCHITGGGFQENIPRSLPDSLSAVIDLNSWHIPPVFKWLQDKGNIQDLELLRTFNCGVGLILCVASEDVESSLTSLRNQGEEAWVVGYLDDRHDDQGVRFKSE